MKRIYLDYAASAPLKAQVQHRLVKYFFNSCGNPSSNHSFGQTQKGIIDQSRLCIASWLSINPREVYFTSGATESINWVIKASQQAGFHIITSATEHKATLASVQNYSATILNVNQRGNIILSDLEDALIHNPKSLVTISVVNNETGNRENIEQISSIVKKYEQARLHFDATQALGWYDMSDEKLNWNYLSASAHKLGGLKGSGILIMKSGFELDGIISGGGQEFGARGGTENIAGILSWIDISRNYSKREIVHTQKIKSFLVKNLQKKSWIEINSSPESSAHIVNFSTDKITGEILVMALDLANIAVSSGAACSTGAISPSHVLLASGFDLERATNAIRVSFGPQTRKSEIKKFLAILRKEYKRIILINKNQI